MRQKPPPKFARVVTVVVALALSASACALEENDPLLVAESSATTAAQPGAAAPVETAAPAQPDAAPQTFNVGDRVALGDWEFVIHSVTDPVQPTDEYFVPEPGNRWLAVDAEVFYNGADAEIVAGCFELQDAENRGYTETWIPEASDLYGELDGDITSGGVRRGGVGFEVPEAATGLRLNFKCDWLSTGNATIDLS